MSQRHTISGRRSTLVWLSVLIGLALIVALVIIVLFVYPDYQRRQQVEQHYQAGVAFQEIEDWDTAVEAFEKVVAMDAAHNDARSRLAEVKVRQQGALATAQAEAARETATAQARAEATAAAATTEAGIAQATLVAATATAQAKATTHAQDAKATATAEALAQNATATAQAQAELEARYQKGLAYIRLKRWDEAKAELDQVVSQDPTYKDVQTKLAEVELVIRSRPTATPTTTPIPSPTATATPRPKIVLEVAAGKPATASGFWRSSSFLFLPSAIVDRSTDESGACGRQITSYWLLPDKQTGWVQVDLQQNYTIVKLHWLNTHNSRCNDRATTRFHIALSETGAFTGEEQTVHSGTMALSLSPTHQEIVLSPPVVARYVRFYVDEFYEAGGGLNELEVYAEVPAP